MSPVLIRGGGITAHCAARLLARAELPVILETADRPKVPAIMVGAAAQKVLQDIFERTDLWEGLPRVRRRVVDWGANGEPLVLSHSAVVISERELLNRIQRDVVATDSTVAAQDGWTVFTSRPLPAPSEEHHFGSRVATVSEVRLKDGSDAETCWVESIEQGWLFLLPGDKTWLLSVGGPPASLLAASRTIAAQVVDAGVPGGEFPCHPRITDPLGEAGWLACGTAALGFDPLCGDGAGHAAREAILGCAVIRAATDGAEVTSLVDHYRARLLAGFRRHLQTCHEFYRVGARGPWWDREIDSLRIGLQWCASRLDGNHRFRYRLNGFALEALA